MSKQVFVDALADSEITIEPSAYASHKLSGEGAAKSCTSLFFPGCSFINYAPDLVRETFEFLRDRGLVDGISMLCCGNILSFEEDAEAVKIPFQQELAKSIVGHGVKRVIAACPNCVVDLRMLLASHEDAADIEVVPLPEVLRAEGLFIDGEMVARVLASDAVKTKSPDGEQLVDHSGSDATSLKKHLPLIAIHDSCPDRAVGEFASSIRELFPQEILVEKRHNRERAFCCGSLANAVGRPDVAQRQVEKHGEEAQEAHAQAMVTYCMSCARFLGGMQDDIPVHHYLEFLFSKYLDWKNMPPYLDMRFLFNEMHGTRDFCGAVSLD